MNVKTRWSNLDFSEQALIEHGNQTPPPSPFSVQAFNRATTSNGAQGFDYGISNNKGEFTKDSFC